MTMTILRETLLRALEKATQTVEDNPSRPVLGNYLLDVAKDEVRIAGTDLEVTAIVSLPTGKQVKVGSVGRVTIPSEKLDAIAQHTPKGATVQIAVDHKANEAHIKAGKTKWTIKTLNAEDYPTLPTFDESEAQSVDRSNFLRALEKCSPFVAQEDTRPGLTMLVCQGGYAIGTNGHQLAAYRLADDLDGLTIPRDATRSLSAVLANSAVERFDLQRQDSHILFRVGGDVFATRLLDAEPPNLSGRILEGTDKLPHQFTVPREVFVGAVGRVYVVRNAAAGIIMRSTEDGIKLMTADERGNAATAEIECDRNGPEFDCISVNAEYLQAILWMLDGDDVVLRYGVAEVQGDRRRPPIRFEEEGFIAVLMQLRVPIPNGVEKNGVK